MKNDMQFTGKNGEFQIRHMVEKTQLNFPVANEEGIKSSVTQTFGWGMIDDFYFGQE